MGTSTFGISARILPQLKSTSLINALLTLPILKYGKKYENMKRNIVDMNVTTGKKFDDKWKYWEMGDQFTMEFSSLLQ